MKSTQQQRDSESSGRSQHVALDTLPIPPNQLDKSARQQSLPAPVRDLADLLAQLAVEHYTSASRK